MRRASNTNPAVATKNTIAGTASERETTKLPMIATQRSPIAVHPCHERSDHDIGDDGSVSSGWSVTDDRVVEQPVLFDGD